MQVVEMTHPSDPAPAATATATPVVTVKPGDAGVFTPSLISLSSLKISSTHLEALVCSTRTLRPSRVLPSRSCGGRGQGHGMEGEESLNWRRGERIEMRIGFRNGSCLKSKLARDFNVSLSSLLPPNSFVRTLNLMIYDAGVAPL